jgi:Holliday junction DNA helicase RuvA
LIRRIRGRLVGLEEESLLIEVGGLTYEVLVPPFLRDACEGRPLDSEIELATFYYFQTDPAKSMPVLMGFETDIQREFFELLTDVPRIGPRAALRAMNMPVATIARAIEFQDQKMLKSLPGVGPQKAKDIIATLGGRLGKFVDAEELQRAGEAPERPLSDVEAAALEILTQLGTSRADAILAIRRVREDDPEVSTPDEIVRQVFRNR